MSIRRSFTAAVAVAAVGAVVALAPVSSAKAGQEVSRFAGSYLWGTGQVSVLISDDGRITGGFLDISGRVRSDGDYSFTVTESGIIDPDDRGRGRKWWRSTVKFAGTLSLDGEGNIVGTASEGESFVWVRQ